MPEKFIIKGGKRLKGEIEVLGAKNAALPILAATILTKKDCIISNLPLIEDVFLMMRILEDMGAKISWQGKRKIKINTSDINPSKIKDDSVKKFRGSILLLGPLAARFGYIKLRLPGGCMIGARPIDSHLDGFLKLGAKVFQNSKFCSVDFKGVRKFPSEIILKDLSVTATENILMALASVPSKVHIKIAASDYQVQDLCRFLKKSGASINYSGFNDILIKGKKELSGVSHKLIYDPIEAGTFIMAGVLTGGHIMVKNVEIDHLAFFLEKIKEFGAKFKIHKKDNQSQVTVEVLPTSELNACSKVQVLPPPGLYADFQPLFGLLATQSRGTTLIHDPLYEARFKYITELKRMGAKAKVLDPHRVLVTGPTQLQSTQIQSFDLRAGATLILASLIAKGESVLNEAYQVDRGYERIEKRLQKLGADIKRVQS